jgi:hypothetical protein
MRVVNVRPEVWWTRRQVKPWKKRDIAEIIVLAQMGGWQKGFLLTAENL